MSYAVKTKDYITASKLKTYDHDPLLYKIIYDDLIECVELEEKKCFVTGTAFHCIMEDGIDGFLEQYYIDDGIVKAKQLEYILSYHGDDWEYEKEAKKRLLPEVRAEYMKLKGATEKIELTPAEGRDIIGMYQSAMEQPMRDLGGEYIKEQRFTAKYLSLNISTQPDRISFEDKDGKRYSLTGINDLLLGKDRKIQESIVRDLGLQCYIRDFKSTGDISKFKRDMKRNPDSFTHGYLTSMSFYFTVLYILYGIHAKVYIDIIETKAPYITDVLSVSPSILVQKIKTISTILDKMVKSYENDTREPRGREERIEDSIAKHYLKYHPEYLQTCPSYIELDM